MAPIPPTLVCVENAIEDAIFARFKALFEIPAWQRRRKAVDATAAFEEGPSVTLGGNYERTAPSWAQHH